MDKFIFLFVVFLTVYVAESRVVIKKLQQCEDDPNYKIKLTSHIREEGGIQIVGGSLKSEVQLGDNVECDVDIFSLDKGEYKFLINAKETMCNALHNYMGDFGYDMQKAAGIEPGTCPLAPGEYSIKDHALDFSKFKFKDVPKGTLKIKSTMVDVKTKEKFGCTELEFSIED